MVRQGNYICTIFDRGFQLSFPLFPFSFSQRIHSPSWTMNKTSLAITSTLRLVQLDG